MLKKLAEPNEGENCVTIFEQFQVFHFVFIGSTRGSKRKFIAQHFMWIIDKVSVLFLPLLGCGCTIHK